MKSPFPSLVKTKKFILVLNLSEILSEGVKVAFNDLVNVKLVLQMEGS